jgi:hypothetical protein
MLSFFSISENTDKPENGTIDLGGHEKSATELYNMINAFLNDDISKKFDFRAYTFDKSSLLRLLSQDTCEGLALYFAKHKAEVLKDDGSKEEKDVFTIAMVSMDKDSKPCIVTRERRNSNGEFILENGIYGEEDGTGHPPKKVEIFLNDLDSIIKNK